MNIFEITLTTIAVGMSLAVIYGILNLIWEQIDDR
jgi:hypothetical protein